MFTVAANLHMTVSQFMEHCSTSEYVYWLAYGQKNEWFK